MPAGMFLVDLVDHEKYSSHCLLSSNSFVDIDQPVILTNNTTVNKGGFLQMSCLVIANPDAIQYRWTRESVLISNQSLLFISNVTLFAAGYYKCHTRNVVEETFVSIKITVNCKLLLLNGSEKLFLSDMNI